MGCNRYLKLTATCALQGARVSEYVRRLIEGAARYVFCSPLTPTLLTPTLLAIALPLIIPIMPVMTWSQVLIRHNFFTCPRNTY